MSELAGLTIQEAIAKVVNGEHLQRVETAAVMSTIMDGEATAAQIAALITGLRMKGETVEEIVGFAETMRAKANRVATENQALLDTCGTGGDGSHTFNISTASAIVAAAGGVRIAKHGNRAISSTSGSADVLEALGVNIQLTAEQAAACLAEVGICFMFAPLFHGSMKHAAAPRKEIGIRTVFNLLGPLTNPAGADRQLVGVYDARLTATIADTLKHLGLKRALVVSSEDGLDELSIGAPTKVSELRDGAVQTYSLTPEQLGIHSTPITQISGGDKQCNADIIRQVFNGKFGADRDIVLLNSAACFYLAGKSDSIEQAVQLAKDVIDSGAASDKLNQLVTVSNRYLDRT
jgi:anthranilate phosphoribosyltransferase